MTRKSSTKENTGEGHQDSLSEQIGDGGKSAVYMIGGSKMSLKYRSRQIDFQFESKGMHSKMNLGRSYRCQPIGDIEFRTDAKGELLYPFKHPRASGSDRLLGSERLVIERILRGHRLDCGGDDSQTTLLSSYKAEDAYTEEFRKPGCGSMVISWTPKDLMTKVAVSEVGAADDCRKYTFPANYNVWVPNGREGGLYVRLFLKAR